MIEDFRQFLKVYRMYKKGKMKMEKFKEFLSEHKNEIAGVAACLIVYKIAYGRGWHDYERVVNNVFSAMKRNGYNVVHLIEPEVRVK